MAVSIGNSHGDYRKTQLLFVVDSLGSAVKDAIFLSGDEAIITATADRSLRVWMKRDASKFWPSALEVLPSPAFKVVYCQDTRSVFAGLENGTVSEFSLAQDLNHLKHKIDCLPHTGCVTGLVFVPESKWILSTSKDKTVCWYSGETGKCLSVRQLDDAGTCLEYDPVTRQLFIGDVNGKIIIFNLVVGDNQTELKSVRQHCVHDQSVTSLSWDGVNSRLFSSSVDNSVVMWNINAPTGATFDLRGHTKQATSVYWWSAGNAGSAEKNKGLVISGGLDGRVIFWLMDPRRAEAAAWTESDVCQICGAPFFWNVKKMWNNKTVGLRQHHCRRCGKAVCKKCSPFLSTLPVLGFEREVRVCNVCAPSITQSDRESLAIELDARHPVTVIRVEENLRLLMTVGDDGVIKIWDIKAFV